MLRNKIIVKFFQPFGVGQGYGFSVYVQQPFIAHGGQFPA